MVLDRRVGTGLEVSSPIGGRERGLESVGVQIGEPHLGAGGAQTGEHPVADGRDEGVLERVAVHDEGPGHRRPAIFDSTSAANSARSASVEVSIA